MSQGSINRYYDAATDQFISIDPQVDTTNQPYMFTNDNPLNSTDPLGLGPFKGQVLWTIAIQKFNAPGSPKTATLDSVTFFYIIGKHGTQLKGATTEEFFSLVKTALRHPRDVIPKSSNDTLTYYGRAAKVVPENGQLVVQERWAIVVGVARDNGRIITAYASTKPKNMKIAWGNWPN